MLPQARTIRDRLLEKGSHSAYALLKERLMQCEAADKICSKCKDRKEMQSWPLAELRAHLEVCESVLPHFPFVLMPPIAFRLVFESVRQACTGVEKKTAAQNADAFREVVQRLSMADLQSGVADAASWNGAATTVGELAWILIARAEHLEQTQAQKNNDNSLADLGIESALAAADAAQTPEMQDLGDAAEAIVLMVYPFYKTSAMRRIIITYTVKHALPSIFCKTLTHQLVLQA